MSQGLKTRNVSKLSTEKIKTRLSFLKDHIVYNNEYIATYENKTNDTLDNVDRYILFVAMQEKQIKSFDIKELVAKWKQQLDEMDELYTLYTNELKRRKENE